MTSIEEAIRSGAVLASVKPLRWEDAALMVGHGWLTIRMAKTPFGIYAVDERNKMLRVTLCGQVLANCLPTSVETAKAAAQADYSARILSALSLDVRALAEERDRLREALAAADAIRVAQRRYMADRGNEELGKAVGAAVAVFDEIRARSALSEGDA